MYPFKLRQPGIQPTQERQGMGSGIEGPKQGISFHVSLSKDVNNLLLTIAKQPSVSPKVSGRSGYRLVWDFVCVL